MASSQSESSISWNRPIADKERALRACRMNMSTYERNQCPEGELPIDHRPPWAQGFNRIFDHPIHSVSSYTDTDSVVDWILIIGAGERIRTPYRLITNCLIINKLLIILEQAISGTLSLNRFNSAGYYRQAQVAKTGQCIGSVPRNTSLRTSARCTSTPMAWNLLWRVILTSHTAGYTIQ